MGGKLLGKSSSFSAKHAIRRDGEGREGAAQGITAASILPVFIMGFGAKDSLVVMGQVAGTVKVRNNYVHITISPPTPEILDKDLRGEPSAKGLKTQRHPRKQVKREEEGGLVQRR